MGDGRRYVVLYETGDPQLDGNWYMLPSYASPHPQGTRKFHWNGVMERNERGDSARVYVPDKVSREA